MVQLSWAGLPLTSCFGWLGHLLLGWVGGYHPNVHFRWCRWQGSKPCRPNLNLASSFVAYFLWHNISTTNQPAKQEAFYGWSWCHMCRFYYPSSPRWNLRNNNVLLHYIFVGQTSLSLQCPCSPVEFKKWSCRPVGFRGQLEPQPTHQPYVIMNFGEYKVGTADTLVANTLRQLLALLILAIVPHVFYL